MSALFGSASGWHWKQTHSLRAARLCLAALFLSLDSSRAAEVVETRLAAVRNPPPVQMLAPGFTVRELPLDLNNINNLLYAPDGRLFALCYDGNVLQLTDTDGDGLEDTASYFYRNDRGEITTCIGMAWGPGGLYIPAKGRVVRLRDLGDGTAELETMTSGWRLRENAQRDFDTYGIAVDTEGNVYFGLCTQNMREAYLIDPETGVPGYDLTHQRGTILKLPAGSKDWQVFATGMRYTCALAFNSAGDLFATEQEGATWLPNGNPFDELLHVQPARHYGFPPRHPKYLPDVIDEPSLFDYGPQHQATCGLHFNEPLPNTKRAVFGPDWWRGDAIVAGSARGKIWRTKLVNTPAGYVAQNHLIAALGMLTIDAVPTPEGDLLVTCHSGRPDWGTGPEGKGKLFKISHTDRDAPQPLFAYAASPTETRVIFDKPLDPLQFRNLAAQAGVTMGVYVAAADRYESIRPGYQAVRDQLRHPRFELPVLSAGLTPDNRSMVLHTSPRTEAVKYAITVPEGRQAARAHDAGRRELPQDAAIDLLSELTGVEAVWQDADGKTAWSGWLPHPDLLVAGTLTAQSEEHRRLFQLLKDRGTLTLRGQLDLWYMLRAEPQPLSTLDFEYPAEHVTIVLDAGNSIEATAEGGGAVKRISPGRVQIVAESAVKGRWVPFAIRLSTGSVEPRLDVHWFTAEDPRPRTLALRRLLLPWAKPRTDTAPTLAARDIPEIAGGDWERGKALYFSDPAACHRCHQVRGDGGTVGPDLSNLVHRDYASVLHDILEPSASINPDYIMFFVTLKDGGMQGGVMVNETPEAVVLGLASGDLVTIPRGQIASMQASTVSLMPPGLTRALDDQQQRDIMTFLLMPPPAPGPRAGGR